MDIGKFRQSAVFDTRLSISNGSVHKSSVSLTDRCTAVAEAFESGKGWGKVLSALKRGTEAQKNENRIFKTEFYRALVKAEGEDIANKAVSTAGLPLDWQENSTALTTGKVETVLKEAERWRMGRVRVNEKAMREFIEGTGEQPAPDTKECQCTPLYRAFFEHKKKNWKNEKTISPELMFAFELAVKQHPSYPRKILTQEELVEIAQKTREKFYEKKQADFRETYPSLAKYEVTKDCLSFKDAHTALSNAVKQTSSSISPLRGEKTSFLNVVCDLSSAMLDIETLLAEMAYEPTGWTTIINELTAKIDELTGFENRLQNNNPSTTKGEELQRTLINELRHQIELLNAKRVFISEIAYHDPFSEKAVAYNELLWANAAKHILSDAQEKNLQSTKSNRVEMDREFSQYQAAVDTFIASKSKALTAKSDDLKKKYEPSREKSTANRQAEMSEHVNIPNAQSKSSDPVLRGKKDSLNFVRTILESMKFEEGEIKSLTDPGVVKKAWCKALNENQDWNPYTRAILVHKDGLTRSFRSTITPVCNIPGFQQFGYKPGQAISSAERGNHHHARNLTLSELHDGEGNLMASMIGHGVLDMWDIADDKKRAQANENGAKEVLHLAVVSNQRIHEKARDEQQVAITHVSINLTTPAGWREPVFCDQLPGLRDFQEQTYTKAQFAAFEKNTGMQKFELVPKPGQRANEEGYQEVNISVDVIAFSFGINNLATNTGTPDFFAGWDSVYDYNYQQMQRYIGNLGSELLISIQSRVEGQRPGGFIGSVMDELEAYTEIDEAKRADFEEKKIHLIGKLQTQTDTVRHLFLTEAYKRGNGDPGKMSREILALQTYAEEALNAVNSNKAATMSAGCKSNKDRGLMAKVDFYHKLTTEKLGGVVIPDQMLDTQDRKNYMAIASTQFRTQELNSGVRGNKSAKNFGTRVQTPEEKMYLRGLSTFVQH